MAPQSQKPSESWPLKTALETVDLSHYDDIVRKHQGMHRFYDKGMAVVRVGQGCGRGEGGPEYGSGEGGPKTAPKDHQSPTANRQPRTANNRHQLPTANCRQTPTIAHSCFCGFVFSPGLDHEAESISMNVRFCWHYEPFSFVFSLKDRGFNKWRQWLARMRRQQRAEALEHKLAEVGPSRLGLRCEGRAGGGL